MERDKGIQIAKPQRRRVSGGIISFGLVGMLAIAALTKKAPEVNANENVATSDLIPKPALPIQPESCSFSGGTPRQADLGYENLYYFAGELDSMPSYMEGRANHYGDGESLNTFTSSGEVLDPNKMAAASWFYPLGTKVMVTDIATGQSVIVVINDRGPDRVDYPDVIIDLTTGAIRSLSTTADSLDVSIVPVCQ